MIFTIWLKIAYSRPLWGGFWGFDPQNQEDHQLNPQKAHPCAA